MSFLLFQLFACYDKLKEQPEYAAILKTATLYHMPHVESDLEKFLFHGALPWRDDDINQLIQRCDPIINFITN